MKVNGGIEWIVDAFGCKAAALADRRAIAGLLNEIVERAALHVVSTAEHVFEGPGGVTAMYLLAESHLTIHTFPESGVATLNLYCCRPRDVKDHDWQGLLTNSLGADRVTVREVRRGGPTVAMEIERSAQRTSEASEAPARDSATSANAGVSASARR